MRALPHPPIPRAMLLPSQSVCRRTARAGHCVAAPGALFPPFSAESAWSSSVAIAAERYCGSRASVWPPSRGPGSRQRLGPVEPREILSKGRSVPKCGKMVFLFSIYSKEVKRSLPLFGNYSAIRTTVCAWHDTCPASPRNGFPALGCAAGAMGAGGAVGCGRIGPRVGG